MYIIAKLYTAYQTVICSELFYRVMVEQAQFRTELAPAISTMLNSCYGG